MRRTHWLAGLALMAVGASGCETWNRQGLRPKPLPTVEAPDDEPAGPAGPKGFFKPTRLSGAMSEEGAEIERSLGVGHP